MRWCQVAIALIGLGCGGSGPTTLAGGLLDDPSAGLAARGGEVFAVDDQGSLVRIGADGQATPLVADAGLAYVIKADEANAYWTDGANANLVPLDGGSARTLGAAAEGWNLQDLNASGDRLFWIETTVDPALPLQTRLSRAYFLGPLPSKAIDTVDGIGFSFTADADAVYWAGTMGAWSRGLGDSDTASLTRLSAPEIAGNVTSDGAQVFWTEQDPGGDALWAAELGGGEPRKLADISRARALALDSRYVYLRTDRSAEGSCLERVPREGGTSEAIARSPSDAFSLAADGDALFWLERGQLLRLSTRDLPSQPDLCGG